MAPQTEGSRRPVATCLARRPGSGPTRGDPWVSAPRPNDDRRRDRRADQAPHDLRMVGPGEGRSDPRGGRQGLLVLDTRGQALPRLQQPADVHEHRPWRRARRQGHRRTGGHAGLRQPVHGHRAARPARGGEAFAELTPGDIDTFFFTNGGAEANENAIKVARMYFKGHKIAVRYRAYHGGTAGAITLTHPAALGRRAGHPGRHPNPGLPSLGSEGPGPGRRGPAGHRGRPHVRGPENGRGHRRRDRRGHERDPHPA